MQFTCSAHAIHMQCTCSGRCEAGSSQGQLFANVLKGCMEPFLEGRLGSLRRRWLSMAWPALCWQPGSQRLERRGPDRSGRQLKDETGESSCHCPQRPIPVKAVAPPLCSFAVQNFSQTCLRIWRRAGETRILCCFDPGRGHH